MEIDIGLQPYEILWWKSYMHINMDKSKPKELQLSLLVDQGQKRDI